MVLARETGGQPLLIEVVRYVRGASNEALRGSEYVFEIGPAAIPVRVPGPVDLLKAKVASTADFRQKGARGRAACAYSGTRPSRLLAGFDWGG